MTIYTGTNASTAMKAVLPKTVSVVDIANNANCKALTVFRKDYCVLDSSGGISSAANIANINLNFKQADALKRPKLITDSQTGRETSVFSSSAINFLTLDSGIPINLNGAFSYLVVFKLGTVNTYQRLIGSKETITDKSAIEYVHTGRLRFSHITTLTATDLVPVASKWYAAIASYDGNGNTTFEALGAPSQSGVVTGGKVGMDLMLGSNAIGMEFTGFMDMAAYFDTNVHGNATLLANIKLMLKDFYGSSLVG